MHSKIIFMRCLRVKPLPRKTLVYTFCLIAISLFLNACSFVRQEAHYPQTPTPKTYSKKNSKNVTRSNLTHTVAPGETFWHISKIYDVPIATILRANRMKKSDTLKMGQRLVIPRAVSPLPIISLYPSQKWKYIIIHHSATDVGNSLAFHKSHLKRGWDRGIGYHFVIDNGSSGKQEGQIETTPRWIKQQDGAHTKASDMNKKGIGICLVGNFNEGRVMRKQMESLLYLVKKLQTYYNIPDQNVMGHKHVDGAVTDCPGSHFPWQGFKNRLKKMK